MDMRLADAYNEPLTLRQSTEDPGIYILRDFKWQFSERKRGGATQVMTNVTIVDPNNGMVSLTIPPKTLVSSFGYSHRLLMKWPADDENKWDMVAAGIVQVIIPQAGRLAVLG